MISNQPPQQALQATVSDGPSVVLITGGATGIGAATTYQLLARGDQVAILGRRKDRLQAFAEEHGTPKGLLTIAGDAADPDVVMSAVDETVGTFGRLDAAIANAGYATFDDLGDGDPRGWRDLVLTNVLGPSVLIRAALPALKQTRGRIVLVGSTAGTVPTAGNIYGATKWAVSGLAENTRLMATVDGVGVTLINPGIVQTPFWDAGDELTPETPMLTSDQIAAAILWTLTQPPGVDVNTLTIRPIGATV